MKRGLLVPLLISAVVLTLGTVAAACGGGGNGDALTLEEYFQQIIAAQTEREAQSRALEEEFNKDYESLSEEEQLKATQDFFDGGLTLLRGFVGALDAIDPPSEVAAAHQESVDAGNEAVEAIQQFVDRLKAAESASELEDVFGDPGFDEAGDRFDQSCVDLQTIADDKGIDVDLQCDEVQQ